MMNEFEAISKTKSIASRKKKRISKRKLFGDLQVKEISTDEFLRQSLEAFTKAEEKSFAEKYNYDLEKDAPMNADGATSGGLVWEKVEDAPAFYREVVIRADKR